MGRGLNPQQPTRQHPQRSFPLRKKIQLKNAKNISYILEIERKEWHQILFFPIMRQNCTSTGAGRGWGETAGGLYLRIFPSFVLPRFSKFPQVPTHMDLPSNISRPKISLTLSDSSDGI